MSAGEMYARHPSADERDKLRHAAEVELRYNADQERRSIGRKSSRRTVVMVDAEVMLGMLDERDQVAQLAAELADFHGGHGDYLSAGRSLTAILDGGKA